MLTLEQMKERVSKYLMEFDEDLKRILITHGVGQTRWVEVTYKRARQWVEAGIDDIDCKSKEKMLELINTWENQKNNTSPKVHDYVRKNY